MVPTVSSIGTAGSGRAPNFTLTKTFFRLWPERTSADQHFVVAHAVEVARVEQRDTRIARGVNRGDALRTVGRTVEVRHSHASEADGGTPQDRRHRVFDRSFFI